MSFVGHPTFATKRHINTKAKINLVPFVGHHFRHNRHVKPQTLKAVTFVGPLV